MNVADKCMVVGRGFFIHVFKALLANVEVFTTYQSIVERYILSKLGLTLFALLSSHLDLEHN